MDPRRGRGRNLRPTSSISCVWPCFSGPPAGPGKKLIVQSSAPSAFAPLQWTPGGAGEETPPLRLDASVHRRASVDPRRGRGRNCRAQATRRRAGRSFSGPPAGPGKKRRPVRCVPCAPAGFSGPPAGPGKKPVPWGRPPGLSCGFSGPPAGPGKKHPRRPARRPGRRSCFSGPPAGPGKKHIAAGAGLVRPDPASVDPRRGRGRNARSRKNEALGSRRFSGPPAGPGKKQGYGERRWRQAGRFSGPPAGPGKKRPHHREP